MTKDGVINEIDAIISSLRELKDEAGDIGEKDPNQDRVISDLEEQVTTLEAENEDLRKEVLLLEEKVAALEMENDILLEKQGV
jgi:chromosome segregation ATPase